MTTEKNDLYEYFNFTCPTSLPKNPGAVRQTALPAGQVKMSVAATLAFRQAGGVTPESNVALDQVIEAIPDAKTVGRASGGKSRTVQLPQDQVDVLKKVIGPNYVIEPASSLRIDI